MKTRQLRPSGFPAFLGRDFFLSGYRIFCRLPLPERRLRGLKILRSDTDSWLMLLLGNLLTHYCYRKISLRENRCARFLELDIKSRDSGTDLSLKADLNSSSLPENSPFADWREARKWCGPLPFTFSPDSRSQKTVVVEGQRSDWSPRPISVDISRLSFFDTPEFAEVKPVLASAFFIENVDYAWKRGVLR